MLIDRTHIYCILLIMFGFSVSAQERTLDWEGSLRISQKDSLRLNFHFQYDNDSLTNVTMDSPDQFAFGIKASKFSIKKDTLQIALASLGVTYKGNYTSTEKIEGTFMQSGKKFSLTLTPLKEKVIINRPQEPKPPFPYKDEEVVIIDNKNAPNIRGTLTMPNIKTPKGTVILISGSGWQDRDESIFGHKPFFVIADYLTREGFAVFRYDDLPSAIFAKSTTHDFEQNVQLIVSHFQKDNRTKAKPIGLLGHSEGGLIAFMAAANNPSIDFIISMAGCAEKMQNILLYQIELLTKAENFTQEEIDITIRISKKVYPAIEKAKTQKEAVEKFRQVIDSFIKNWSKEQKEKMGFSTQDMLAKVQSINNPWFFNIMKIDPVSYIKKIKSPVLALNGEKDSQVYYKTNLDLIAKYLPKTTSRQIKSFPHLNHLFQTCETGMVDEYGKIEETLSPKVLESILFWLNNRNE